MAVASPVEKMSKNDKILFLLTEVIDFTFHCILPRKLPIFVSPSFDHSPRVAIVM